MDPLYLCAESMLILCSKLAIVPILRNLSALTLLCDQQSVALLDGDTVPVSLLALPSVFLLPILKSPFSSP